MIRSDHAWGRKRASPPFGERRRRGSMKVQREQDRTRGPQSAPPAAPGSPRGVVEQRRSSGLLRIPFVRRCHLQFEDGSSSTTFIVNINVLGAYVSYDAMPLLGQRVACRFGLPGSEIEVVADGSVAWINPQQTHPVHSLPPGFGIRFERLSDRDRVRIEELVRGYISTQGGAARR
jgi:Tfp pilus assembly protein PilZ